MRPLMACLALLMVPATAGPRPLDSQDHLIRWAAYRYCVDEPWMRAMLRMENGRRGSEAGMNPVRVEGMHSGDVQAYCDPTAPCGAEQHGRLARRKIRHLIAWLNDQPQLQAEWLEDFTRDFYRGGNKSQTNKERRDANYAYFRTVQKLWFHERRTFKNTDAAHAYNPLKCRDADANEE